jgi:hypothetical protein
MAGALRRAGFPAWLGLTAPVAVAAILAVASGGPNAGISGAANAAPAPALSAAPLSLLAARQISCRNF